MIISDYDTMDNIVMKNNNLSWVGWDVAFDNKNDAGYSHINGVFKNGCWYIRKLFPVEREGWNIPDRLVGKDVQMVSTR